MSRLALSLLAVLALAAGGVGASGADFTASSSTTATMTAAADFNTVAVGMSAPPATLVGSVALAATASSDRGIASVTFERAPVGTSDWVDACVDAAPPYGCSWDTVAVPDGAFLLRARATDTAGYTRTTTATSHTVDNHTLAVTLDDPGAMSGTESLRATAVNATGGLAELTIQHRAPGATTWTTLCTGSVSPRTCGLDTVSLPDGGRELRATARDGAGHQVQSTAIMRTIDNTPPEATADIPPTATGSVTVSAEAVDSGSGIASVTFQALYLGTWYDVCVDTQAPFTCTADSAQVPDGNYSIRVVTRNNAGVQTISDVFPITVDNPPRPTGLTTTNAVTPGQLGPGDTVRFTWTEQIAPATVLAGWSGTGTAIRVRVKEAGANDEMDFYSVGGARLELVRANAGLTLGGNFVAADAEFGATISQSVATITVTFDATVPAGLPVAVGGTMRWQPSASATDLSGKPSATTAVTDTGGADVDF